MTKIIDVTPQRLLKHQSTIKRMKVLLEMIERQSKRLNNMIGWRNRNFYDRYRDERKIEISEMALNRLIKSYNESRLKIFYLTLPHTDKKYLIEQF